MRRWFWLWFALLSGPGQTAVFVVDTTSDGVLGDCTEAAADCSLRGALQNANAIGDLDDIHFDIPVSDPGFQPDTGHWLILVGATALPPITQAVVIDGFTQPGASANTQLASVGGLDAVLKVEIRPGTPFGTQQFGLDIGSANFSMPAATVRGLAINRFSAQILLHGSAAHRVEGCYLGTDITGTSAALSGNSGLGAGVRIQGPGPYQIGGLQAMARNLISGLSVAILFQSGSNGLVVQGNLIGTNAAGDAAIAIKGDALSSAAPLTNAQIGGTDSDARNVISGAHFSALRLFGQALADFSGTRIEGNYFGTDVSGRLPIGNGLNPQSPSQVQPTIQISGLQCVLEIGGQAPGAANLIAFGGGAGILNDQCRGIGTPLNRFLGNRGIPFDNVFGGGALGATPNDAGDTDEIGGNRLQNFPELQLPDGFLNSGGDSVALQYRVDSAITHASYPITVNFYRGACGGGSETLIASDTYGEAEAQQWRAFMLSSGDGNNLLPLVATAVDAAGNTSEFTPMIGDVVFRDGLEDEPMPESPGSCH